MSELSPGQDVTPFHRPGGKAPGLQVTPAPRREEMGWPPKPRSSPSLPAGGPGHGGGARPWELAGSYGYSAESLRAFPAFCVRLGVAPQFGLPPLIGSHAAEGRPRKGRGVGTGLVGPGGAERVARGA